MVSRVCRGLLTLSLRPRVAALRPWLQAPAMSAKAVSTSADGRAKFRLTLETVNARVKDMQYAVRGQLPIEAMKIEDAIANGETSYPFDRVLFCNIGDCHAMGQQPLTFVRQLVSACLYPPSSDMYPLDVRERAKTILDSIKGGSLGGYSDSRGIAVIRQHVAQFIGERDGIPCDWHNVYLVNGASDGIKGMLFMFMSDDQKAGVMIPIPQYPLYTASIAELAAHPIGYHLDEAHNWAINVEDLRKNIREARGQCQPRVLVVINPGNPTGQYLPLENMKDIIKFCHDEGLVLFTDEVYQENVYAEGATFHSFRKVVKSMGSEYDGFQMASFNSTSKGFFGECGMRGGYMELMNFDDDVMDQLYKFCSAKLCSNTAGQVVTDALVKRPQPGDPSFELHDKEKKVVLLALKNKAKMVYDKMNKIPGVQCNEVQGAMYAFPKIDIPEKALKDAQAEDPNMTLDTYYCLEFLRQKGVCVVPGSGFGQKPGTWHFRTTILPSEKDLEDMLDKFADFHIGFLRKYEK